MKQIMHPIALTLSYLLLSTTVPTLGFHVDSSKRVLAPRREANNQDKPTELNCIGDVSRRQLLFLSILPALTTPQRCHAGFFSEPERRDLSFCLVILLRVQYWAQAESRDLQVNVLDNEDRILQYYLETRLGAKAAVTGKVGGGSTSRVYTIASLNFRETLDDLRWYARKANNMNADALITDLIEALASLVEFDGLETTIDPSPRSSLMRSMYDKKKLEFVRRMLAERIIPTAHALFNEFDSDIRDICLNYVSTTYPNELPTKIGVTLETGDAQIMEE